MADEDFFTKLDAKLKADDEETLARATTRNTAVDLAKAKILEFTPILSAYNDKLKERGLATRHEAYATRIELVLEYVNGNFYGYRVEIDRDDGSLIGGPIFREDGKSYGIGRPAAKVSDIEGFEQQLKYHLSEAMNFSVRGGGLRKERH